jgi:CheY-like chemotaxis protein
MPDRFDAAACDTLWEEGGLVVMRGRSTSAQSTPFLTSSSVPTSPPEVARLQRAYELRAKLELARAHMPGMDGFEVIARLRVEERLTGGHLPVVALTARARTEDRERCFAAGMDEFLAKPVRADALWSTMGGHAERGPRHAC